MQQEDLDWRARFEALLDAAVDAIVVIDEAGRIQSFSRAAEKIFGYSQSEAVGQPVEILMPSPYREEHAGYLTSYLTGAPPKIMGIGREVVGQRKDGSTFPLHLSVGEVSSAGKRSFVGILRDVSNQKKMEKEQLRLHAEAQLNRERLAHAGRLQILGEMAAGIAHEINQPLSAISTYAQAAGRLLQSGESETGEQLEILKKIAVQAQRAGEVIRRMRALAAEGETSRQIVDINDVVGEVLELAEIDAQAHEYILKADLAPSLPAILADRIQIQQVVLNLVHNAIEAMLDGDGAGDVILIRSGPDDEGRVEVCVIDQGVGLAKEDEDRVFDPFFSTKQAGLGIGLSISQSIIHAHGGEMGFRRNQGPGMTFFFNLPTAEESTVGAS